MSDLKEPDNEANSEQDIGLSSGNGLQFERRPKSERPSTGMREPLERLSPIERVRFGILSGFGVLMLIPVVAFVLDFWFITDMSLDGAIRLITTLSAATSGLVGAVVGYYFGQNSNASIS